VASSHDAIVSRAFDGAISSWNEAAARLFGYSEQEAVGKSIFDLIVPPDLRMEIEQTDQVLRRGGRVAPFESARLTKDGTRIAVLVAVSPVKDAEGRLTGSSAVFRDLTELNRVRGLQDEAGVRISSSQPSATSCAAPWLHCRSVSRCFGVRVRRQARPRRPGDCRPPTRAPRRPRQPAAGCVQDRQRWDVAQPIGPEPGRPRADDRRGSRRPAGRRGCPHGREPARRPTVGELRPGADRSDHSEPARQRREVHRPWRPLDAILEADDTGLWAALSLRDNASASSRRCSAGCFNPSARRTPATSVRGWPGPGVGRGPRAGHGPRRHRGSA